MEKKLKKISKQLKGASKLHAGQAKKIDNMIKKSPTRQNGKVIGKLKRKPILDPITKDLIPKPLNKKLEKYKFIEDMRPKPVDPKLKKHMFKNTPNFKSGKKPGFPMKSKNVASAMKMKTSPALAKLSASCKAAAKRKFKVYPSAYANMWAAKTQRQGKC